MFENVLGQSATGRLIADIGEGRLAPAMLFQGPPASGKGTAALELGRVISCEAEGKRAAWNCQCPACVRHRSLSHPDMLCLGWRPFCAEISASAGAYLREASVRGEADNHHGATNDRESAHSPAYMLFVRSVRKLLARFNPVLWEDDPKAGKVSSMILSLEESLDELEQARNEGTGNSPEKLAAQILKGASKLEADAVSENIPIAHLRRAAGWSHLTPSGRAKLLVIENSERMQEEGRNSLLKLLEEPPGQLSVVLTSSRPGSLLPTMLSRLRPYRFIAREREIEDEVIRRVFRDSKKGVGIGDYLDSFLPVSMDTIGALSAFFAASAAYKAALLSRKRGAPAANEAILLGKYCAPKAEAAGLGRPCAESGEAVALVLEKAEKFEIRSLFSRFLRCLLDTVSMSLSVDSSFLPRDAYFELWKKNTGWAENAAGVYNLRPAQVLEKLFTDLSRGMAEL